MKENAHLTSHYDGRFIFRFGCWMIDQGRNYIIAHHNSVTIKTKLDAMDSSIFTDHKISTHKLIEFIIQSFYVTIFINKKKELK